MQSECPYCKNELEFGSISGGRYSFKWYSQNMKLYEKLTVFGGELLSEKVHIKAHRCKKCNKIIIDLNDL